MTPYNTFFCSKEPLNAPQPESKEAAEKQWQVIVLNDPVNLMSYVVMVFRRVFGMDIQTAKKHMMEVHQEGSSILYRGSKEQAELYVQLLQQWQLNAFIEPDA